MSAPVHGDGLGQRDRLGRGRGLAHRGEQRGQDVAHEADEGGDRVAREGEHRSARRARRRTTAACRAAGPPCGTRPRRPGRRARRARGRSGPSTRRRSGSARHGPRGGRRGGRAARRRRRARGRRRPPGSRAAGGRPSPRRRSSGGSGGRGWAAPGSTSSLPVEITAMVGWPAHGQAGPARGRRDGHLRGRQAGARRQQEVALDGRRCPAGGRWPSGATSRSAASSTFASAGGDLLHGHHGVAAHRQDGPGHHLDAGGVRGQRQRRVAGRLGGLEVEASHPTAHRLAVEGHPVHGHAVERRGVPLGEEVLPQHGARGAPQRQRLDGQRRTGARRCAHRPRPGSAMAEDPLHVVDGPDRAPHGTGDLRASLPRPVGHRHLDDRPAGPASPDHLLEGPTGSPVPHPELEPVRPASGPHRTQVGEGQVEGAAQAAGEVAVGDPGVDRPGAGLGGLPARRGPSGRCRRRPGRTPTGRSRRSNEPSQSQKATISVVAAARPAAHAAPKPRWRSSTTVAPERAGHRAGAVGGPVVHHDGEVPRRQPGQHRGQGGGLVERREHHRHPARGHPTMVPASTATGVTGRGTASGRRSRGR